MTWRLGDGRRRAGRDMNEANEWTVRGGEAVEDRERLLGEIDRLRQAFRVAVEGLLHHRDFLGIQLSHAWGYIDDKVFEEDAEEYLQHVERSEFELQSLTDTLLRNGAPLDAEVLSTMLRVPLTDARKALDEWMSENVMVVDAVPE